MMVAVIALVAATCQGVSPDGSPSRSTVSDGLQSLVTQLRAAGAPVTEAGAFTPNPLSGRGVLLCIADEPVRVYENDLGSSELSFPRLAAALGARISGEAERDVPPLSQSAEARCRYAWWAMPPHRAEWTVPFILGDGGLLRDRPWATKSEGMATRLPYVGSRLPWVGKPGSIDIDERAEN